MPKPLCGSQQTVENSERYGNTRPPYLPPGNLCAGQEAAICTGHGLVPNWERSTSRLYIVTLLAYLICRVHHAKWFFQHGCESGTIKKAEHERIDAFDQWCWRRLLRVPRPARWSNQSILKEISPEYSLEGLLLKLKFQSFGHLMGRTDSLEKDPDAGKDWRWEEKGMTEDEMVGWHHGLDGRESEWTPGDGDGQGGLACCDSWGRRVGHDWVTSLSLFTFMHWRRKCQPTPAFLPGESQGQRSLVGCRLWGHTESDTIEVT